MGDPRACVLRKASECREFPYSPPPGNVCYFRSLLQYMKVLLASKHVPHWNTHPLRSVTRCVVCLQCADVRVKNIIKCAEVVACSNDLVVYDIW